MKKFRKNVLKSRNGITLIALVITIIVLLILAGISISMLSGDNGILQKATTAKEKTERAEIVENAKMDILAKLSEKKGEALTEDELEDILTSTNYNTQGRLSSEQSVLDRTLTSKNGKYMIPVSEIYNGTLLIDNTKPKLLSKVAKPGDFVDYTVGNWTDEDIALLGELYVANGDLPTSSTSFQFGGFTTSTSKDSSINAESRYSNIFLQGWRVLNIIKDESGNDVVNIIHSGTPEAYYSGRNAVGTDSKGALKSEYILSGSTSGTASGYDTAYFESLNIPIRQWSMYEDKKEGQNHFAIEGSARCVKYDEIEPLPTNNNLRTIGVYYWLPYKHAINSLYAVKTDGTLFGTAWVYGIRPVVSLKSSVMAVKGDNEDSEYDMWRLSLP